jgi:hypothetical protein
MKNLKFKNLLKWLELHFMKFRPPPQRTTLVKVTSDGGCETGVNDTNHINNLIFIYKIKKTYKQW